MLVKSLLATLASSDLVLHPIKLWTRACARLSMKGVMQLVSATYSNHSSWEQACSMSLRRLFATLASYDLACNLSSCGLWPVPCFRGVIQLVSSTYSDHSSWGQGCSMSLQSLCGTKQPALSRHCNLSRCGLWSVPCCQGMVQLTLSIDSKHSSWEQGCGMLLKSLSATTASFKWGLQPIDLWTEACDTVSMQGSSYH